VSAPPHAWRAGRNWVLALPYVFVADPETRGRWIRCGPEVLVKCPACESGAGQPCRADKAHGGRWCWASSHFRRRDAYQARLRELSAEAKKPGKARDEAIGLLFAQLGEVTTARGVVEVEP